MSVRLSSSRAARCASIKSGLPLVMALLLGVTGYRDPVYYLVPLLGALLVWTTARLAARFDSRWLGAAAALLLVARPTFVLQVPQPVSDVPAAAWWTGSLLLALHTSRRAAVGAGAAASMAILTRPNLVPLAAGLGVLHLWRIMRTE
jgi:4-amino-4-deoxy-L-arabinose transferase-like glycosyltransferase